MPGKWFYVTAKGYFELDPRRREGDWVVILMSVDVLFILELSSREQHVIGETFVEGIMHGVALNIYSLKRKTARRAVGRLHVCARSRIVLL